MDFISIDKDDPIMTSREPILICCKAGDMILWDSRTVHCNTPGLTASEYFSNDSSAPPDRAESLPGQISASSSTSIEQRCDHNEIIRLVAYVCMLPRSMATPRCLELRKLGFVRRSNTSHWPTQKIGNNGRHVPNPVNPEECSDAMLALVGYSEEERAAILNR